MWGRCKKRVGGGEGDVEKGVRVLECGEGEGRCGAVGK